MKDCTGASHDGGSFFRGKAHDMRVVKNPEELINKRFGKLTVREYLGVKPYGNGGKTESFYLCECDCGNHEEIRRSVLLNGKRKSCGHCHQIIHEQGYYRYYDHNGNSFIYDADDHELVSKHKWMVCDGRYVKTAFGGNRYTLGRFLLSPPDDKDVDHINGDKLDNRRCNLRVVTRSENLGNQGLSSRNTTGYKGVSFVKCDKKYRAYINHDYKRYELGRFNTPEEAARAYDEAARFYFGQFACVNFPREGEQGCRRRTG